MKFSKRERFLIGLLIVIIIWALAFRLVIGPAYARLVQTKGYVQDLQEEKAGMDLYLEQFPDLEEKAAAMDEEEKKDFFYCDINDQFMDRSLQEMAGQNGLEINRMRIDGPRPMDEKKEEERAEETPSARSPLMETVITMEVESPGVDQLKEFAQAVYQLSKSVLISYIDMKEMDEASDGSGPGNGGRSKPRDSGQAGGSWNRGLKGIVEVRYYYEKTR